MSVLRPLRALCVLARGMIIMPCELLDDNGDKLKAICLKHIEDWGLRV